MRGSNTDAPRLDIADVAWAVGQATWRSLRERSLGSRVVTGHARLGHCPVCSRAAILVALTDGLRDTYHCLRCGSIPRQRAFMEVLGRVAPDWHKLRIHESSPDGASSRRMAAECPGYDASQYWPDVELGSVRAGVRCEDVTRLTLEDASLDAFVTQDVFEHVLAPEKGFAEIARVLRPGGLHVFTVPWYWWKPTLVRARGTTTAVRHFEPPEYHANPVDPRGSLVATEWGSELPHVILQCSGMSTTAFSIRDPRRGIVGAFVEVMVSRKPG